LDFVVPAIPSGTYTWHSQLSDPVTGEILSEDTAQWACSSLKSPEAFAEISETITVDADFGKFG